MRVRDIQESIEGSAKLPPDQKLDLARRSWARLREIERGLVRAAWTMEFDGGELKDLREYVPVLEAHLNRLEAGERRRQQKEEDRNHR